LLTLVNDARLSAFGDVIFSNPQQLLYWVSLGWEASARDPSAKAHSIHAKSFEVKEGPSEPNWRLGSNIGNLQPTPLGEHGQIPTKIVAQGQIYSAKSSSDRSVKQRHFLLGV
jgi:hypothetical protein